MNIVRLVAVFNSVVLNVFDRPKALLNSAELGYAQKAIAEEAGEFQDAHESQNFIGAVDAVIDLLYFGIGFLIRMGLSEDEINRCFQAVHNANMAKKAGVVPKRSTEGVVDATKPEDWVSPEEAIAEILGG